VTTAADIIGPQAAAASPEAVHAFSRKLGDHAHQASAVARQIRDLHAAGWQGSGATAFEAQKNGSIPGRLDSLAQAFDHGSQGLSRYGSELSGIKQEAEALARRKTAAASAVHTADQRAVASARDVVQARHVASLATEPGAVAATGRRVAHAVTAAAQAGAAHAAALKEAAATEVAAAHLRGRLQVAGHQAHAHLAQASGAPAPATLGAMAAGGAVVSSLAHAANVELRDRGKQAGSFILDSGKTKFWGHTTDFRVGDRILHKLGTYRGATRKSFSSALRGGLKQRAQVLARAKYLGNVQYGRGMDVLYRGLKTGAEDAFKQGRILTGAKLSVLRHEVSLVRRVPYVGAVVTVVEAGYVAGIEGDPDRALRMTRVAMIETVVAPLAVADFASNGIVGDMYRKGPTETAMAVGRGEYGDFFKNVTEHGPIKSFDEHFGNYTDGALRTLHII
jgi:hypothetical protein